MEQSAKRRWIAFLCLVCSLFITMQAWASRYAMNPDGISYLDMAERLLQGDFSTLVHPYWSPLYPTLLAIGLKLSPASAPVFPVAHAVNWLIGLGALAGFTFLVAERARRQDVESGFYCRTGFAYMLFLWATMEGLSLAQVIPDLCVAALLYLIACLCCRLADRSSGRGISCLLGIVLGLAVLSKAAMLPLGIGLLVILALPGLSISPPRSHVAVAAIVFGLIIGAYGLALSRQQHRFTLGDAGKLNYAWLVAGEIPLHAGWIEPSPTSGTPAHPPRLLSSNPTVIAFKEMAPGTYPLWYNPAFFHEGLRVKFDLRKQFSAVAKSWQTLRWAAGSSLIPLLAGLFVLFTLTPVRQAVISFWTSPLGVWPVLAMTMFALVTIEARYVAPFLVLFWLAVYDAATPGKLQSAQQAVLSVTAVSILLFQLSHLGTLAGTFRSAATPTHVAVSRELRRLGLHSGDEIATVGPGFSAYYAKLAKLRIVASIGWKGGEYADTGQVEALTDTQFDAIKEKLREVPVKAIVSHYDCAAAERGRHAWHSIANTDYCVLLLP
jgi:hypothetical protein